MNTKISRQFSSWNISSRLFLFLRKRASKKTRSQRLYLKSRYPVTLQVIPNTLIIKIYIFCLGLSFYSFKSLNCQTQTLNKNLIYRKCYFCDTLVTMAWFITLPYIPKPFEITVTVKKMISIKGSSHINGVSD